MASRESNGGQFKKRSGLLGLRTAGSTAAEVGEMLSSKEKRHYSRALKEMHELVKLESLKLHLSRAVDDADIDNEASQTDGAEGIGTPSLDYEPVQDEYLDSDEHPSDTYSAKGNKTLSRRRQKKIYTELCSISKGLQLENDRLKNWDAHLREEEAHMNLLKAKLKEYEDSLDDLIEHECQRRCKEFEKTFEQRILDVSEESKRTKLSFKVMKQANDSLKKQNSLIEQQSQKLQEKVTSLNNRVSNLQRKNEILKNDVDAKKSTEEAKGPNKSSEHPNFNLEKRLKQMKTEVNALSDAIGTCLDWVAESQLKQNVLTLVKSGANDNLENDIGIEISSEKSFKVIQQLPSVLEYMANAKSQIPFLRFVYWSLLLSEFTQKKKSGLPLTAYRRIGEELFKSQIFQASDSSSKKSNLHSQQLLFDSELCTRILSEFIILKTLSQADVLAKALELLKHDTRKDEGKDLFIGYHGSTVLLSLLMGQHKGLTHLIVDVLMQMTVESPYLGEFLDSLGNQPWINVLCDLFRSKSLDSSIMEKLSIIVQRLSKIKSNYKFFENVQFSKHVKELAVNTDIEKPFYTLNLRSILLNLNPKGPVNNTLKKV